MPRAYEKGSQAHTLLLKAEEALQALREEVLRTASYNDELEEESKLAGAEFIMASGHARRSFDILRGLVDDNEAIMGLVGSSVGNCHNASDHTGVSMMTASADANAQQQFAHKLNSLISQISEADVATAAMTEMFSPIVSASQAGGQSSATGVDHIEGWLGSPVNQGAINHPAATQEVGSLICRAFAEGVQDIDRRLGHL